jgi:hypothetical protein
MNRGLRAAVIAFAAMVAGASPAAAALPLRVEGAPLLRHVVRVAFPAAPLPAGGYYYAVLVLRPYRHYTRASPPPCSVSSNMLRTAYGYPGGTGRLSLTLAPAPSHTGHWCPGGSYEGGVYAVPHPPPCHGAYPCRAEPYTPPSPCWNAEGHLVCGVVVHPLEWAYPDRLPAPVSPGASIVARFSVRFPSR